MSNLKILKRRVPYAGLILAAVTAVFALLAYAGYEFRMTNEELNETKATLEARTLSFEAKIADLEGKISELEGNKKDLQSEKKDLTEKLTNEQSKNTFFAEQIQGISTKVGTLEKLNKLDEELLKKYSKIYFLNENYIPSQLVTINEEHLINKKKPIQIHGQVASYFEKLIKAAKENSIDLKALSGYRSFGAQSSLKSAYVFTYGAGTANQFSAEQGYSEHQLGTTIDFTTSANADNLSKFETASAFPWLKENAHKYGFILSYPKGNSYYVFEPWHWRFVGTELAEKIRAQGKNFYDLDQREIDEYLIKIFD